MINLTQQSIFRPHIIQNKNLEKQFFILCKNKQYLHIIPDQLLKNNLSIQNKNNPFISHNTQQQIEYTVFAIDGQQKIYNKPQLYMWDNEILELMIQTMHIDEEATFYVSSMLSPMLTNYKVTNIPLKVKIKAKNQDKLPFSTSGEILYLRNINQTQEYKQELARQATEIGQKQLQNDRFQDAIVAYQYALNILYDNPPQFHDKLVDYLYLQSKINFFELPCTFELMDYQASRCQSKNIDNIHTQRIQIRMHFIEALINAQKHRQACYQILCAACEMMCFQITQQYDQTLEKCIEYLLIIDQSVIKILNPKVLIIELAEATKTNQRINEIIQRNKQLQQDELYVIQLKYKHYLEKINLNSLSQLTYKDTIVVSDEDLEQELKRVKYTKIKDNISNSQIEWNIENQIIKSQQWLDDAVEHYKFGNIKGAVISSYIGLLILKLDSRMISTEMYNYLENVLQIDPLSNEIEIEQKSRFVQLRTKLFRRAAMCYEYISDDKNALTFNKLVILSQLKDEVYNIELAQRSLNMIFNIYQKINDYDNLQRLSQYYMSFDKLKQNDQAYNTFKEFSNKTEVFYKKYTNEKQALVTVKYKNMFLGKK